MSIFDFIKSVKHNRNLYKSGKADRDVVVSTTVGWRPDPINGEDGYAPDPGNQDHNERTGHDTPSGNREYHRVIRRKR